MAVIEEALQAHLEGHAGLSALVSNRVYPVLLRQGSSLPAVSYQLVGGESLVRHGGPMGNARPFFQIDAWANTYATAKAVAEQVKLAMFAFKGTFSGVAVADSRAQRSVDFFEADTRIYRVSRDFQIVHAEAVT